MIPNLPALFTASLVLFTGVLNQKTRLICRIKCGVVTTEEENSLPWLDLVELAWKEVASRNEITDIALQFVPIKRRTEYTMDMLIEAYMEIGATNVSAMFGPHVQSIAMATEKFTLPYLVLSTPQHGVNRAENLITVNPAPEDIFKLTAELLKYLQWTDVAIIYDSDEGAHLMEKLVLLNTLRLHTWKVQSNNSDEDLRSVLLLIRNLNIRDFILYTSDLEETRVLNVALHLSMLSSRYRWVLPDMTIDEDILEPYIYTEANITTYRLVQSKLNVGGRLPPGFTELNLAVTMDSILALYHAVKLNFHGKHTCKWTGHNRIHRVLSKVADMGVTGRLRFWQDGRRRGYVINILNIADGAFHKVGYWDSFNEDEKRRLHFNMTQSDVRFSSKQPIDDAMKFGPELYRVATVLVPPFVQLKKDHKSQTGNEKYEGFCVDVLNALAEQFGFKFQIFAATERGNGRKSATNWPSERLVGELLRENASLACGPLVVTSSREEVIDFTVSFLKQSISFVMKRPERPDSFFYFFHPMSLVLWLLIFGMVLLLSITLYIVDRVSPPEDTKFRMTPGRCLWFTVSSVLLKGIDVSPRTASGRILAAALWIFSVIVVACYSAGLATLLAVTHTSLPLKSISDLTEQNTVKYGTVKHSSVSAFFASSQLPLYKTMWNEMTSSDGAYMTRNSLEGFQRTLDSSGDYAFVWDSLEIRQSVARNCQLMQLGDPIEINSYAIGVPQGAKYRDALSKAILKLDEAGVIHELEGRWWPEGVCPDPRKPELTREPLTLKRMAGIFVLLGVGVIIAVAVSVAEYCVQLKRDRKKAKNRKVPEESASAKPLCDGNSTSGHMTDVADMTSHPADEGFPSPKSYRQSKQTSIF